MVDILARQGTGCHTSRRTNRPDAPCEGLTDRRTPGYIAYVVLPDGLTSIREACDNGEGDLVLSVVNCL